MYPEGSDKVGDCSPENQDDMMTKCMKRLICTDTVRPIVRLLLWDSVQSVTRYCDLSRNCVAS